MSMKKNHKIGIIIISLIVMLLCALFSVFAKNIFTQDDEYDKKTSVSPKPSPVSEEGRELSSSGLSGQNAEALALLKKNSINFLETYFYIPDGTERDEKDKWNRLSDLVTNTAKEKYVPQKQSEDEEVENGRRLHITTHVSFSDISFFVAPDFTSSEATVFIDCEKGIKTNEMKKAATSHYQFSGNFIYNPNKKIWLCDEIISSEDIVPAIEDTHAGD